MQAASVSALQTKLDAIMAVAIANVPLPRVQPGDPAHSDAYEAVVQLAVREEVLRVLLRSAGDALESLLHEHPGAVPDAYAILKAIHAPGVLYNASQTPATSELALPHC